MGMGLILAGLGKGIADAGTTYGNMGFKAYEAELSDQRALQKAAAIEKLKEEREEAKLQRDAAKAVEVDTRAQAIGQQRASKAFDPLAASSALAGEQGDISLTKEQLQAAVKDSPALGRQYRDMGLIGSNLPLTRNEARLQTADDQVQSARELGASSTLLKSYQDTKKSVLDEITKEAERARDERRLDQQDRREDRRDRADQQRFEIGQRQASAAERRADAAMVAANRPRGGAETGDKPATTADLQRQINAARDDIALELGSTKTEVNAAIASVRKKAEAGDARAKAKLEAIQPFLDELTSANERMRQFKRPAGEKDAGASAKPPSAPASSSTTTTTTTKNYSNLWK